MADPAVLLPQALSWPTVVPSCETQGIPAIMSVDNLLFPEKRVKRITVNETSRPQFLDRRVFIIHE
jgi:hypothetical protein